MFERQHHYGCCQQWRTKDSWTRLLTSVMMCESRLLYIKGENNRCGTLTTVCEESLDVESCVSCSSSFIWD